MNRLEKFTLILFTMGVIISYITMAIISNTLNLMMWDISVKMNFCFALILLLITLNLIILYVKCGEGK